MNSSAAASPGLEEEPDAEAQTALCVSGSHAMDAMLETIARPLVLVLAENEEIEAAPEDGSVRKDVGFAAALTLQGLAPKKPPSETAFDTHVPDTTGGQHAEADAWICASGSEADS